MSTTIQKTFSTAANIYWRVRWGQDWLYVYLLMEFQSSVDPWMAVRIQTYLGLLYQDLIRAEQLSVAGRLPPVACLRSSRWCSTMEPPPGALPRRSSP